MSTILDPEPIQILRTSRYGMLDEMSLRFSPKGRQVVYISEPKRQNPFPLHLVKLRYTALHTFQSMPV